MKKVIDGLKHVTDISLAKFGKEYTHWSFFDANLLQVICHFVLGISQSQSRMAQNEQYWEQQTK